MTITRILVPAAWVHEGAPRNDRAEFKLGKGPCGLSVEKLSYRIKNGCLYILQGHTDSTSKVFVYPLAQLHGRVEIEYA
jgi:hypothetical protein